MSARKTAIVVCPGRGTYNAPELGYLHRFHGDQYEYLRMIDEVRKEAGQSPITELDKAEKFSPSQHGRGDNASLLIYACAIADFMAIDRDQYDIVGVTGNSMGWYLSLAAGGAMDVQDAAMLVNTMGSIMTENGQGGQVVFLLLDENWKLDPSKKDALDAAMQKAAQDDDLFVSMSIHLGGMAVLAANDAGIKFLLSELPKDDRFPFQIRGHSAFHSSLLDHCVPLAREQLGSDLIDRPKIPMIDGLGNVWNPFGTNALDLYEYTLGRQINETYDFSKAIQNSAKEFAPDVFIVLGPGTTIGAPVAQSLIAMNWDGISSKESFKARQEDDPIILSMGIFEQRQRVLKG